MQTNSGIANSGSGAATSSSAARASVPRDDHPTAISETATYAFVAWLTSIFGYLIFLVWALTPDSVLRSWGITYYPNRYYCVAIPAYFLVVMALAYLVYISINLIRTPGPEDLSTVFDQYQWSSNIGGRSKHEDDKGESNAAISRVSSTRWVSDVPRWVRDKSRNPLGSSSKSNNLQSLGVDSPASTVSTTRHRTRSSSARVVGRSGHSSSRSSVVAAVIGGGGGSAVSPGMSGGGDLPEMGDIDPAVISQWKARVISHSGYSGGSGASGGGLGSSIHYNDDD